MLWGCLSSKRPGRVLLTYIALWIFQEVAGEFKSISGYRCEETKTWLWMDFPAGQ